jgi:hypothetical protein
VSNAPGAAAVEHIEAEAWAQLHLALPAHVRTHLRCEVIRFGPAVSIVTPGADVASANRTLGLGLERDLTDEHLRAIHARYLAAGVPRWLIEWSPAGRPRTAADLFSRWGGREKTPTLKLYRGLTTGVPRSAPSTLRVVEIGRADAASFEATVAEPLGVPKIMAPIVSATVGVRPWRFYLVLDGERPVAGAAMFVHGDGAWFGLSATLPGERGRGAQTALLARRLHDAVALGCTWASADTQPDTEARPNPSYRNLCRAGFAVLYRRAKYLFEAPSR